MADSQPKSYMVEKGEAGLLFMQDWCWECERDKKYRETSCGDDSCQIIMDAFGYDDTSEDECAAAYPKELIEDKDGTPRCTAFHQENRDKTMYVPESALVSVEWLSPKERQRRLHIA